MSVAYVRCISLITALTLSVGCTPFSKTNPLTGSALGTVAGGGVGYGITKLLKVNNGGAIAALTLSGAGVGYYLSSQRFASSEMVQAGGKVFTLGQYVTINLPTDNLFLANSSEFAPNTESVLASAASVLSRYPQNNVVISGNMSGFGSNRFEKTLSQARARQVAAFLWAHGFNSFNDTSNNTHRLLMYTGYGSYFPVANHEKAASIRQNSRIEITAFPSSADLDLGRCQVFDNPGADNDAREIKHANLDKAFEQTNHFSQTRENDFARSQPFTDVPLANSENIAPSPISEPYSAVLDQGKDAFKA